MLAIILCIGNFLPIFASVNYNDTTDVIGMNLRYPPTKAAGSITTNVTGLENVTDLTVCLNVKVYFAVYDKISIACLYGDTMLIMQEGWATVKLGSRVYKSNVSITPFRWTHICVTFGPGKAYYVNGERAQLTAEGSTKLNTTRIFNPVRSLAHNEEIPEDGWNFRTWETCSDSFFIERNETGIDYNSSTTQQPWECDLQIFKEKSYKIFLPRREVDYVITSGRYDYETALVMCHSLRGTLPQAGDPDLLRLFTEILEMDDYIQLSVWGQKSSPEQSCYTLSPIYDPEASFQGTIQTLTAACEEQLSYFSCKVSQAVKFEMRQDRFPSNRERFYFVPDEFRPRLLSLEGKVISLSSSTTSGNVLLLQDYAKDINVSVATAFIDKSSNPFGRRTWTFAEGNKTSSWVLTACSKNEFTCDTGVCLDLAKRCSGKDDCGDESDEQCKLIKPLPSSYSPSRPPKLETPLDISLKLVAIKDVDVDLGKIQVQIQINTTWADGRVTLIQMSNYSDDNFVDKTIWKPSYYFANGFFEDNVNYIKKKNVIERTVANRNSDGKMGIVNSYEGFEYNAESNANITHIESVASSFDCDFDLLYYPFEVHLCEIQIALTQFGAYKAYFDTRMINLQPDNFTLTDFTTQPICYTFVNQSTNQANLLKIHIMLSRRYGAYILTTFLPCIVLTIIGSLTEFFEDDNFSDRINVTLAALIVIASLISQVAMTVPVSAQPKLIDMYFCFSMFRLFSCFVHHSLLCLVRCFWDQRDKKREEKATNVQDSLLPLKDDDDVPAAPTYSPPSKKNLLVDAWQLVAPQSPKQRPTSWTKSTLYRVVNVTSISVGLLLDVIVNAIFVFVIFKHSYEALRGYEKTCQK
ncbi:uncharacterized protein LOC135223484 isoform X2 [Macrobrachium nipponense]|uniref:uncharacterized protein LOC135223484 isoform X2 n=1 Tax=Macrobrachium nipponense TaxID=159736 RepID=UPI0030C892D4